MIPRFSRPMTILAALLLASAATAFAERPEDVLSNVGSVPREVAGARDIARLEGSVRLDRVILVLLQRDAAGLARLLAEQHDPASPDFHRWLSPAEFERRFGASDGDVATLVGWLESHGLDVESAPAALLPLDGALVQVSPPDGTATARSAVGGRRPRRGRARGLRDRAGQSAHAAHARRLASCTSASSRR